MATRGVIRTIYLYLFSIIGLVLLVIGAVGLIDMLLKATVFTQAESQRHWMERMPPSPPGAFPADRFLEDGALDPKERELLRDWATQYQAWQERGKDYDPVRAQRERDAARNIALIVVGLPLYLYHWRTVRREAA